MWGVNLSFKIVHGHQIHLILSYSHQILSINWLEWQLLMMTSKLHCLLSLMIAFQGTKSKVWEIFLCLWRVEIYDVLDDALIGDVTSCQLLDCSMMTSSGIQRFSSSTCSSYHHHCHCVWLKHRLCILQWPIDRRKSSCLTRVSI